MNTPPCHDHCAEPDNEVAALQARVAFLEMALKQMYGLCLPMVGDDEVTAQQMESEWIEDAKELVEWLNEKR